MTPILSQNVDKRENKLLSPEERLDQLMRHPENIKYGRDKIELLVQMWDSARNGDDIAVRTIIDFQEEEPPPHNWVDRTPTQVISRVNISRLSRELPFVDYEVVKEILPIGELSGVFPTTWGNVDHRWSINLLETIAVLRSEVFADRIDDGEMYNASMEIHTRTAVHHDNMMKMGESIAPYWKSKLYGMCLQYAHRALFMNGSAEYTFVFRREK